MKLKGEEGERGWTNRTQPGDLRQQDKPCSNPSCAPCYGLNGPIIDIKGYKEVVFIEREASITLNWQEQYEEAREANRCTTNTNGS